MVIDAIILAGGKGSRFNNKNKGLLVINNKPFATALYNEFKNNVRKIFINSNSNHQEYKTIGIETIRDDKQGYMGPLEGIKTIMRLTDADYLFVIPVDSPKLDQKILQSLKKEAIKNPQKIICCTDGIRKQPLICLIPLSYKKSLESYLSKNNNRVFPWFNQNDPIWCQLSKQKKKILNINKPSDYKKLDLL